jgi:hypothetical protein
MVFILIYKDLKYVNKSKVKRMGKNIDVFKENVRKGE